MKKYMDIVDTGGYLTALGLSCHIIKNCRFCGSNNKFGDFIKACNIRYIIKGIDLMYGMIC